MLSRVASNLYWLGRYLERSEHMARYTKVQYFTIFDAPSLQDKNFALQSIINMAGIKYESDTDQIDEEEVLHQVGMDRENGVSLYSNIYMARENARSARNMLSDELWEYINKCYIYVNKYDPDYFKTRGLYEFTREINDHVYKIKSCLYQTLLHDLKWVMINLGVYLERSIQITRIAMNKVSDIEILQNAGRSQVLIDYQWTTMLKMVEGFDIYNRLIRNQQKQLTPEKFILQDTLFPRSIQYNLDRLNDLTCRTSKWESKRDKLEFMTGKVRSMVKYQTVEDLTEFKELMSDVLSALYDIHTEFDKEFFHNMIEE